MKRSIAACVNRSRMDMTYRCLIHGSRPYRRSSIDWRNSPRETSSRKRRRILFEAVANSHKREAVDWGRRSDGETRETSLFSYLLHLSEPECARNGLLPFRGKLPNNCSRKLITSDFRGIVLSPTKDNRRLCRCETCRDRSTNPRRRKLLTVPLSSV